MSQPLDDRDVAPWADDRDEEAEAYQEERESYQAEAHNYPSEGPVY